MTPKRSNNIARHFCCLDCKADTGSGEYYMLRGEIWLAANPKCSGMLCIGCVETRLGRTLMPEDFSDAPLNDPTNSRFGFKSARLMSRITGHEADRPTNQALKKSSSRGSDRPRAKRPAHPLTGMADHFRRSQ
jgi:hypothetical protein